MSFKFKPPIGNFSQINGKCISLVGDDIDTDRIIPARFLKCIDFDSLGKSVFDDDRKTLKGNHPFDLESNKGASILIVNSNFGCGSSSCLLYTSPSPRDATLSRMPSSA